MNLNALKQFIDSCPENYCPCISTQVCECWCTDSDNSHIYWKDSEGVYSGWMFEGIHEDKGYSICNLDTQQRVTTTAIFDNKFRISHDEFESKYGDEM